jgi:hypothetical protein
MLPVFGRPRSGPNASLSITDIHIGHRPVELSTDGTELSEKMELHLHVGLPRQ